MYLPVSQIVFLDFYWLVLQQSANKKGSTVPSDPFSQIFEIKLVAASQTPILPWHANKEGPVVLESKLSDKDALAWSTGYGLTQREFKQSDDDA